MKRWMLAIGIVALFMGMASLPAGANLITKEIEKDGPGWQYIIIGRIRNYEIIEYNGTEYLSCRAIHVRSIFWNVFEKVPRLPIRMTLRFGQKFNIPLEGAKIYGPNLLGRSLLIARGEM